jgi:hypothetical protein
MIKTKRQKEILKCLLNVIKSSRKYITIMQNFMVLKETYGTFILVPTEKKINTDDAYWEIITKKLSTQSLYVTETTIYTLSTLKELTFDLHKLALLTREEYLDIWKIYLLTLTEFNTDTIVDSEVNFYSKMPWLLTILLMETVWSVDEYKGLLVEMFTFKRLP